MKQIHIPVEFSAKAVKHDNSIYRLGMRSGFGFQVKLPLKKFREIKPYYIFPSVCFGDLEWKGEVMENENVGVFHQCINNIKN